MIMEPFYVVIKPRELLRLMFPHSRGFTLDKLVATNAFAIAIVAIWSIYIMQMFD